MITLNELKSWRSVPRVHPNGFIQIDVPGTDARERIHIWPAEKLPTQSVGTQIHDHIFNMASTVLKGALENIVYRLRPSLTPEYDIYLGLYKNGPHDNTLLPTHIGGRLEFEKKQTVLSGHHYFLPAFVFHDSVPLIRPCVTYMTKTYVHAGRHPRVLARTGQTPDNSFSRHCMTPEALWEIIERSLRESNNDYIYHATRGAVRHELLHV